MEKEKKPFYDRGAVKITLIGVITLLLLIPMFLVGDLIDEREEYKEQVTSEVAGSYADKQTISAPKIESVFVTRPATSKSQQQTDVRTTQCKELNYKVDIDTDVLHRSIYDVTVYNSKIDIEGKICVIDNLLNGQQNTFTINVSDYKGLQSVPELNFGGKQYTMKRFGDNLVAQVDLPQNAKKNDLIDFSLSFDLKGTESLLFQPNAGKTTLEMRSAYPHPSFRGTILPCHREVRDDGFEAKWSVLNINTSGWDTMGVKFVEPANPYQQSERSMKYGILIILLVFVAALLVEFLTHKSINLVQYVVIGLSLVLFYSLLLSFSEFILFGLAYLLAAVMTAGALTLYFKAILKHRSGYMLGGFVAFVYLINYMLLQMEVYALLAGSLVLFALLCGVMYLTANTKRTEV